MSLARLLTTNGSLGRKVEDSHRFKMTNPLPKFAPVKRTISLTPIKKENADQHVMKTSPFAPQSNSPVPSAREQVSANPEIGVLSVGVFETAENATVVAQPTVKPMKSESLFSKVKNIFRRKPAATPSPAPVQTEWSLDKVKVVRNDLSDVDLDIVFASVDAAAPVKQAPAKKEKLVSSAWRRVNPNPQKQEQMVLK